jgi:hypothetical protein
MSKTLVGREVNSELKQEIKDLYKETRRMVFVMSRCVMDVRYDNRELRDPLGTSLGTPHFTSVENELFPFNVDMHSSFFFVVPSVLLCLF